MAVAVVIATWGPQCGEGVEGRPTEAKEALELINGMYRVEHEAERRDVVGTAEHLALRREDTRSVFVRLLLLSREIRRTQGPKALLGRAAPLPDTIMDR